MHEGCSNLSWCPHFGKKLCVTTSRTLRSGETSEDVVTFMTIMALLPKTDRKTITLS